jgi:copper homeostasis protein (lipoprotein)
MVWLSSCSTKHEETVDTPTPDPEGALAERSTLFEGTLPCADCEGIRYRLLLRPDSVFFLRQTYLGKDTLDSDDIGRWHLDETAHLVRLRSNRDQPLSLRVLKSDTLRVLDLYEHDIVSDLNYSLVRIEAPEPFEPSLHVRGMYSYVADAPLFRECSSELRLPVAMEAEHAQLERAYLDVVAEPGLPMLAEMTGRITTRRASDGGGFEEVMVVEHFEGVWPGESCGAQGAHASLENTFWGLVRMQAEPVRLASDQREVHIRFLPGRSNVQGFAGCNTFNGAFKVEEDRLSFGALGSTRMACPYLDLEVALFTALGKVTRYRIVGDHLELFDATGHSLLRFEARYFR